MMAGSFDKDGRLLFSCRRAAGTFWIRNGHDNETATAQSSPRSNIGVESCIYRKHDSRSNENDSLSQHNSQL